MLKFNRRRFLQGALAISAGAAFGQPSTRPSQLHSSRRRMRPAGGPDGLISDIQRRSFNYFWDTTEAARGLAPDFGPDPSPASVAAMGFALSAVPVGVENGWIPRAAAAHRVQGWLKFLAEAPQGPDRRGCAGYKGFYYHFLDMHSGTRYLDSELSTIDTALLIMGVRFCGQYFDGLDPNEAAIRTLADSISERVDWPWAQAGGAGIRMGWRPETGFMEASWIGYNEAMLLYLLALGSESHPVEPGAWDYWTSGYKLSWGKIHDIEHLTFGALFAHHFTQVWVDLRGLQDPFMANHGLDYFENTRRAILSQRAYAMANPLQWSGYGPEVWGLSACDGPTDRLLPYANELRQFHTYAARGVCINPVDNYDDGTLAPSAAIGCLPFAPDLATDAVVEMHHRYGDFIYGHYGFLDSFNPSFTYDVPLHSGWRAPHVGWVDTRYYGITQGPIVTMIENQRSELIWNVMRSDPVIRTGLVRAGFSGGWLG